MVRANTWYITRFLGPVVDTTCLVLTGLRIQLLASGYFLFVSNINNLMRANPGISVWLFIKVQFTKII